MPSLSCWRHKHLRCRLQYSFQNVFKKIQEPIQKFSEVNNLFIILPHENISTYI